MLEFFIQLQGAVEFAGGTNAYAHLGSPRDHHGPPHHHSVPGHGDAQEVQVHEGFHAQLGADRDLQTLGDGFPGHEEHRPTKP